MAFQDDEEGPPISPSRVFAAIRSDPQLGPNFDKVIEFGKRLPIRPHTVSMTQTEMRFSGRLATNRFLQMRLARNVEEALPLLNKLLECGFFVDVANIGRFRNADVHYKLFTDQNSLDVYVKVANLRVEMEGLKTTLTTEYRDDLFHVLLHDIVLMFVERQSVLESELERERGEYKNLYDKYQDTLKRDYSFYLGRVQELERALEVERRRNEEKQRIIERLRSSSSSDASTSLLPTDETNPLSDSTLTTTDDLSPLDLSRRHHIETTRLRDDISTLKTQNDTLSRHNELLVQKFNLLREAAQDAFKQRGQQRQEVVDLREQLAAVREKYRTVMSSTADRTEEVVGALASRVEVEREAKAGALRKVEVLEGQIQKVQAELVSVAQKLQSGSFVVGSGSGSGSGPSDGFGRLAIESSASIIQGKIQQMIRELEAMN